MCNDIVRVKTESVNSKRAKYRSRKPKSSSHATARTSQRQPQRSMQQPERAQSGLAADRSLSLAPPIDRVQGFASLANGNGVGSSQNQFSDYLLMYSEDIIGLFGDGS